MSDLRLRFSALPFYSFLFRGRRSLRFCLVSGAFMPELENFTDGIEILMTRLGVETAHVNRGHRLRWVKGSPDTGAQQQQRQERNGLHTDQHGVSAH